MSLVRLLIVLIACCLVAQPAFTRSLSACTHAADADHAGGGEHEHHGHDTPEGDTDGGCDCGCPCADLACAHGGGALALPNSPVASAPPHTTLPPLVRTTAGSAQAAADIPLRPPNRA